MDIQRKKGLLDVCVLAVLRRGPSYGYKIIGEVSSCIEVSESTLYPILNVWRQTDTSPRTHRSTAAVSAGIFTSRTRARNALMHFWTNGTK